MGSRTSPRAGSRSPAWPSCQMSANQAVATKRGKLRMPPERRGWRSCLWEVRGPSELDSAFAAMTQNGAGGLPYGASSMFLTQREHIAELSRSLLKLAERDGRASYPQFTAARGIPTWRPPSGKSILSQL